MIVQKKNTTWDQTNKSKADHFLKTDSHSANKEISRLLLNPKLHCHVIKTQTFFVPY